MGYVPPGIVFVNSDISESVRSNLIRQLFINEVQDGYVFDGRMAVDSSYPSKIKQLNLRILVIRSFQEFINRGTNPYWTAADIVLHIKMGLAYLEINRFGPPGLTLPVLHLYWGALGVY